MSERIIFSLNAPTEFPPEETINQPLEQVEAKTRPEPLSKELDGLIRPFIRDKEVLAQLTSKDAVFINSIVSRGIEAVFGHRQTLNSEDLRNEGYKDNSNTSINKEFSYVILQALIYGNGSDDLIEAKKAPSRTEARKRIGLLRGALAMQIRQDEHFGADILQRCHSYLRKERQMGERERRLDIIDASITLAEVVRALYEQGLFNEGQYYAFGKHIGTVVLRGDTPTGDDPEARERHRKRELASDIGARDAAISLVKGRYIEKAKLLQRPHSEVVPLSDEARRYFSWLLGNKINSQPPVSRQELRNTYMHYHRAHGVRVDVPSEEKIDLYLSEALLWTFTAK